MFTATLEDGVSRVVDGEIKELDNDLHHAALDAADAGVKAAKQDHLYRDRTWNLTNNAFVEENAAVNGGWMTWPEFYASFVNYGTVRSKPYPFVPLAIIFAKERLSYGATAAAEDFCKRIAR